MRLDTRFLGWGLFFILLGAIPLAVQANLLDRDLVARAWQLWPLFIVGAGVGLLLRKSSLEPVGGLIAAGTAGVIAGSILAVGPNFSGVCGGDTGRPFPPAGGTLAAGTVDVQFNCGTLAVGTAPGSAWTLSGSARDGLQPRIDTATGRLGLQTRAQSGFLALGTKETWSLVLPQDPTLDFDLQLNAGTGNLAFGGAHLGSLSVHGNAGSVTIDLGAVASVGPIDIHMNAGNAKLTLPNGSVTGTLDANAGTISFCVPEGVGVRVTANDSFASANNFGEQGLTKSGDTWETANFAAATNRVTLAASVNAGSVNLNPKDGCR